MIKDAIDSMVDEIDRLSTVCKTLEDACKLYRKASIQSHTGHWDRTGRYGEGCEECINAKRLREEADLMLSLLSQDKSQ